MDYHLSFPDFWAKSRKRKQILKISDPKYSILYSETGEIIIGWALGSFGVTMNVTEVKMSLVIKIQCLYFNYGASVIL